MKTKPDVSRRMAENMKQRTLGNFIAAYVSEMKQRGRTKDSIQTNAGALPQFAHFVSGKDIAMLRITLDSARNYVCDMQERKSKWIVHPNRPAVSEPLSPFTVLKAVKVSKGF